MSDSFWPPPGPRARHTVGWMLGTLIGLAGVRVAIDGYDLSGFFSFVLLAVAAVAVAVTTYHRWRSGVRHLATTLAGIPAWDLGWTAPRDAVSRSVFARDVPPWAHAVLGMVGGHLLGQVVIDAQRGGGAAAGWKFVSLFAVGALTLVALRLFRGSAQVKFERFPYLLGEPATFWIAMTPGSPRLERGEVLLRCVLHPTRTEYFTGWSKEFRFAEENAPGPDEFFAASFQLPGAEYVPGTTHDPKTLVRWELVISGRTRWGTLTEAFDVPVYAPHPAAA